ncbi:MAG: FtsX-like permease family protein [Bacteroidales bacterium]|nr:FtsX-like permease family protein [Bacteroidales bacterium]
MKSYLKFLSRNKLYTAIEAVGLSVSLAFVIISFCYVMQQYAVPRENPDRERIYAVGSDNMTNGYGMKEIIGDKIPEVECVTHFYFQHDQLLKAEGESFVGNVLSCDRDFFDIFPVQFKEGGPDNLTKAHVAFISEKLASKMKGEVVGKQVIAENDTLTIVGVISDLGSSLLYDADIIGNIETCKELAVYRENPLYYHNSFHTFIKAVPNADRALLAEKVDALCKEKYDHIYSVFFKENVTMIRLDEIFFSETKCHLRQGDRSMLRTVVVVGLLLLLSALINYINLNVALVGKRAKEMASRRLLGAQKSAVIGRFLAESFWFTLGCFIVGLLLAYVSVPYVNDLLRADVAVRIPFTTGYLLAYLLMVVVVSLLAGILPALIVSQTKPIDVVKGTFRFRSRKELSRLFMVVQNVISIVLIAVVITMQLQMRHMMNRPVGLQTDNLYFVSSKLDDLPEKTAFVDEVRSLPCVKELAFTENVPGVTTTDLVMTKMGETERNTIVFSFNCDTAAFRMLGFQVVEQFHEPEATSFWMTESAVAGLTGLPYGDYNYDTILLWRQGNIANDVCGVIKDFNMLDALHAADEDFTIVFSNGDPVFARVAHPLLEILGDHKEAKRAIDAVYEKHCMAALGTYMEPDYNDFLKNVVASKYGKTKRQMRLIELIMAVSVLLSLLGLVAMSAHFASERERSIAIRKVFGGTLESETCRSLIEYLILMLLANAIAVPIAIYVCGKYLECFAYRIDLSPWIFILAVVLSLLIACLSVLWQTLRAAKTNPAEALKKE